VLREQVQSEGYCALRLCADLSEFIQLGRAKKTYLKETDWFLDYIGECLKAIESFGRETIERPPEDKLIKSRLRDLGEIRKAITWLYSLSKQAIDADSLAIPFPLAIYLNHLAKELHKQKGVKLVVLGGSTLNYYKWNLRPFRELTRSLASTIKGYPILDEETGILMFPYCAAREVLVNCNLFHEMGHYFYEQTQLESHFSSELEKKLSKLLIENQIMAKIDAPLLVRKAILNYVQALMCRWADEIFSDMFAIQAIGPAFHMAYREIEQIIPLMPEVFKRSFSETHPADDFRFKIHAKWLLEKWGKVLERELPSVFEELRKCSELEVKSFSIYCSPPVKIEPSEGEKVLHQWMLYEFEQMVEEIEKEVVVLLGGNSQNCIDDFELYHVLVTDYLGHGVVPSTCYDENKLKHHPSPTTVLNCGFFFYLSGMQTLLERVKSAEPDIDKRMKYERKLNDWLGKAIEDWQILLEEGQL
jgi:hypothetical protein